MNDDAVTVSIEVAVDPHTAFRVFTANVDTWWLRGPKHRFKPPFDGRLRFESGASGRLMEEYSDGSAFVIGRVLDWRPGERLLITWRLPSFVDKESTEVEVRFEPVGEGTRVSVAHRGWHTIRRDHPARHGTEGAVFEYMKASLWGENLGALRRYVQQTSTTRNDREVTP